jgi:hypothetical protein
MILSLINSYNEAGDFLNKIFADALREGLGRLLGGFGAHQDAPHVRVS